MPKTTNELPDVDVETLNAMIADLGREIGCPPAGTVYPPDLVELGEIPGHIYGYNRGCRPDGVEMYKAGPALAAQDHCGAEGASGMGGTVAGGG